MSTDKPFTKENLDTYLKELAKVFRKLNGTKMPAEIILIGGAAILANYGFRDVTYDIDAIILASAAMKDAINQVGDSMGLPHGWLNADFQKTTSFSKKLLEVSVYYKTYSNILTIRTVASEYLVAMKLMSGRQYKNDMSDVAGILWEHQKADKPISYEAIDKAVTELYSSWSEIPERSVALLKAAFDSGAYEMLYRDSLESERNAKETVINFNKENPGALKDGAAVNEFLEQARKKQQENM